MVTLKSVVVWGQSCSKACKNNDLRILGRLIHQSIDWLIGLVDTIAGIRSTGFVNRTWKKPSPWPSTLIMDIRVKRHHGMEIRNCMVCWAGMCVSSFTTTDPARRTGLVCARSNFSTHISRWLVTPVLPFAGWFFVGWESWCGFDNWLRACEWSHFWTWSGTSMFPHLKSVDIVDAGCQVNLMKIRSSTGAVVSQKSCLGFKVRRCGRSAHRPQTTFWADCRMAFPWIDTFGRIRSVKVTGWRGMRGIHRCFIGTYSWVLVATPRGNVIGFDWSIDRLLQHYLID